MTLNEALEAFIKPTYFDGSVFFNSMEQTDEGLLIRDGANHDQHPTRFKLFPQRNLYLRLADVDDAETTIRAIHAALDVMGPLELATGYKLFRCEAAGLPIFVGKDSSGLWAWTFDLLMSINANATI